MSRRRVAVLFGGCSTEHEVSLETAAAFLSRVDARRFEAVPVGIDRETGAWSVFRGNPSLIARDRWREEGRCVRAVLSPDRVTRGLVLLGGPRPLEALRLDAALPLLHGRNGEDGTVQGALELAGIPVVGCGAECSAVCMDKRLAHVVAGAVGVPCARSVVVDRRSYERAGLPAAVRGLALPAFVKPVRSGSSIGVSLVGEPAGLEGAVRLALEHDDEALVEERVSGSEVGVAVLERDGELVCGEPDEIELAGGFFDYHEKYTLETSRIHVPARISPAERERARDLARLVFRALGCRGFARVDLFRTPDGRFLLNEVNTVPGLTAHSRFPMMMAAAGWPFEDVVGAILEEGTRGGREGRAGRGR